MNWLTNFVRPRIKKLLKDKPYLINILKKVPRSENS